ncbi:MAG: hypothetical protein AAF696_16700 [Bacteroidota bacterium]
MASLAFLHQLPRNFEASFEVPVRLNKPKAYYEAQSLSKYLFVKEIDIKKANLEVLTQGRSWPQGIGYLHAATYLGFFFYILFYLSKILKSFEHKIPFASRNPLYVRNIGFLTIGLGIYEFLIMLLVCSLFHDKFRVLNGHTIEFPSFWDLNIVAIFLGLVLLSLAEVFKQGEELQDLESQTV